MDGTMLARLAAAAFVGVAITATAIGLMENVGPPDIGMFELPVRDDADPVRLHLQRCRDMGEAATGDIGCLNAWAENRDRFLRQATRQTRSLPVAPPSDAIPSPAPDPADRLRPSAVGTGEAVLDGPPAQAGEH